MEAIASIGGRQAVAGYDALMASEDHYRWLARQRDDVAGAVLTADGERFAAAAAIHAAVPWIGDPAPTPERED